MFLYVYVLYTETRTRSMTGISRWSEARLCISGPYPLPFVVLLDYLFLQRLAKIWLVWVYVEIKSKWKSMELVSSASFPPISSWSTLAYKTLLLSLCVFGWGSLCVWVSVLVCVSLEEEKNQLQRTSEQWRERKEMSLLNLNGTYDDETCLSRLSISAETNESIVGKQFCSTISIQGRS